MDGQSGVEIRNSILDAMGNLISTDKKSSSFDKMFLGRIKNVKNTNLYDVIINGKTYANVQGIKSFEVNTNDIVFCIVPQNNINMLRVLFSLSKDLKNIQEIKKEISNNLRAIISLQNKLSGIDLPFNKGQGIVLNTNETQYKLYGDSQSSNIFWEITKNGQTDYISAQPRRPYRVPIYTAQAASKTDWDYTITFDETLGTPAGILFEHITHYDDYVCTFYPLSQLINITTLLIGYRDCYINFKDMQITYTKNSLTFKAVLKGQDGFKEKTQGAYVIW